MKVVVITGSRKRSPSGLRDVLIGADLVIVGDCPTGVDALTRKLCREMDIPCAALDADWAVLGKAAGPERNGQLAHLAAIIKDLGATVECHAYPSPDGSGTQNCIEQLKRFGLKGTEHKP